MAQEISMIGKQQALALAEKYGTPLLVLSRQAIQNNYQMLIDNMPKVKVHYAMKANPFSKIIEELALLGSNFDVASDGEIEQLSAMGITGERMLYANPMKTVRGMNTALQCGVRRCTFDSVGEAERIAKYMPGAVALLRLRIINSQALVDLNKKFGVMEEEVLPIMRAARNVGLDVAGICFHVGSQSLSAEPYISAIKTCQKLFQQAQLEGFDMRYIDIGGGFPLLPVSKQDKNVKMLRQINNALEEYIPDNIEIWSEPGRFLCANAVTLLTSVIGSKIRDEHKWYFLDEGIYGTFSGAIFDHWEFDLVVCSPVTNNKLEKATFAGPSCDSFDVIFESKKTTPLQVGDILMSPDCGAYTSASATVFNGFAKAPVVVWEEENDN